MKITNGFCDIHPSSELRQVKTIAPSSTGDWWTIEPELKCSLPNCERRYSRHGAYFSSGGFLEPRNHGCDDKHPVEYRVLTEIKGVKTWACPADGCALTKPYEHLQLV